MNINNNQRDGQAQSGGLMFCWLDLTGKLVFMSAGIRDPKQSQAGGLSKDLGVAGFNGLLPFLWTVLLEVHENI